MPVSQVWAVQQTGEPKVDNTGHSFHSGKSSANACCGVLLIL